MTIDPPADPVALPSFARHAESAGLVAAPIETLFAYLDDHPRLSAHMSRASWRMGGGRMEVWVGADRGQQVGSRILLTGRILGLPLSVETTVVERHLPRSKVWQTVREPRLLVVGHYRMGWHLDEAPGGTRLRVWIDYDLPRRGFPRILGALLGGSYAAWCTRMMVRDAQRRFAA